MNFYFIFGLIQYFQKKILILISDCKISHQPSKHQPNRNASGRGIKDHSSNLDFRSVFQFVEVLKLDLDVPLGP
jgi:hypothetical protein